MQILHIADMHLGAKLSGFSAAGKKYIKSEIEKAKKNFESLAMNPYYDGIIFAGDIFDSPNVSPHHIKYLENLIRNVLERGTFVVFASGNHDYFISKKHFQNIIDYPNFVLFTEENVVRKEIKYKDKRIAFYGIGYQSFRPQKNLRGFFMPKQDEDIAIAVLHGDVTEGVFDKSSDYFSVPASELAKQNYDYTALGHIHKFKDFGNNIIYPGCPFGQGMDETGEKYIVSLQIEDGITSVEKKVISDYKIYDLEFNGVFENRYELAMALKNYINENFEDSIENSILRIKGIISGFDDYVSNEDAEFRAAIFGEKSAENHRLELFYERENKAQELYIPKELNESVLQAIDEFYALDELAYESSKLDCHMKIKLLMDSVDIKSEIFEIMRQKR